MVLEGNNIVHYWRDNSQSHRPWIKQAVVSRQATGDASLIQSSYGNPIGHFEAVILEGNSLVHYWRDNSPGASGDWTRVEVITSKATGPGALIQSSYGSPGNFEVVVPEGHDLVHYWRKNSDGSKRWYRAQVITNRATGAASLIQSTYRSDSSAPGNFELIVMEGRDLVHYWRDNSHPGDVWTRQAVITTASQNGPGTLIESSYGNLELLVVRGNNITHFWRDPSSGNKWIEVVTITNRADGPASFIQSSYGTPSNPGNFEAIVVQYGHNLDHYWRDNSDPERNWGFVITISTEASG